jgi:hypothetical protein
MSPAAEADGDEQADDGNRRDERERDPDAARPASTVR